MLRATPFVAHQFIVTASLAAEGDASGAFDVQGATGVRAIRPAHAAAFVALDSRNPRQEVIEILLSDQPIDVAAAAAAIVPHVHAINQKALMGRDYVVLWVRPDGSVSMNATFGATMNQYIDKTGAVFKAALTSNTSDRVSGRVFTTSQVETLKGERYTVDLTFSTAVSRLPPGQPLGAGGEEPGRTLQELLQAASSKNWAAVEAASSPRALSMFKADDRSQAKNAERAHELLQTWLPKTSLTVTGGTLRGDTADLEIEGDMFPGTRALYVARMVRLAGVWKFDAATLVGML